MDIDSYGIFNSNSEKYLPLKCNVTPFQSTTPVSVKLVNTNTFITFVSFKLLILHNLASLVVTPSSGKCMASQGLGLAQNQPGYIHSVPSSRHRNSLSIRPFIEKTMDQLSTKII